MEVAHGHGAAALFGDLFGVCEETVLVGILSGLLLDTNVFQGPEDAIGTVIFLEIGLVVFNGSQYLFEIRLF